MLACLLKAQPDGAAWSLPSFTPPITETRELGFEQMWSQKEQHAAELLLTDASTGLGLNASLEANKASMKRDQHVYLEQTLM